MEMALIVYEVYSLHIVFLKIGLLFLFVLGVMSGGRKF